MVDVDEIVEQMGFNVLQSVQAGEKGYEVTYKQTEDNEMLAMMV